MKHSPHHCPQCHDQLWITADMWGPYYLCEECGWSADDDDLLDPADRPARAVRFGTTFLTRERPRASWRDRA